MDDWYFHTPAWVDDDLPKSVKDEWNDWQANQAASNLEIMVGLLRNAGQPSSPSDVPYVNPDKDEVPPDTEPTPVDWDGFPARVTQSFSDVKKALEATAHKGYEDLTGGELPDGWSSHLETKSGKQVEGQVRDRQDEYLEWEAVSAQGKLLSVTFVAEGYDYWKFLFEQDPERVAQYYRDKTGNAAIQKEDLRASEDLYSVVVSPDGRRKRSLVIPEGEYNYRNQFNQGPGIVHLSHKANALEAEVNLAVTSALPRIDVKGDLVGGTPPERLLCCTAGGEPNRSSDPRIAGAAYAQIADEQSPKRFTLTDPIGLYIQRFPSRALQDPDQNPVPREKCWVVERGSEPKDFAEPSDSRILRLRVAAPEGADYTLGDMYLDGSPITHPAQIAKQIKMHLLVNIWPAKKIGPRIPCSAGCCKNKAGELSLFSPHKEDRLPLRCEEGLVDAFPGLVKTDEVPGDPMMGKLTRLAR